MAMSREIDAKIAEKVMGVTFVEGHRGITYSCGNNEPFCQMDPDTCPPYSTDIAAAWECVEKMQMYEPNITWSDSEHEWIVSFDKCVDFVIADKSAPMAICLAALKAKGVEV